jgi:Transposase DDE domain
VWGKELFFDATKVRANADLESLVPRFADEAKTHVADLFADETAAVETPDESPPDAGPLSSEGLLHLPLGETPTEQPWKLLEERRLDPNRPPSGSYRRTSDWRVSPTDPDATPMQTGNGTVLGCHDHDVVDGGKHRIVLAAPVTPADVLEDVPMRALLWRVCFRRKLRPHRVTGDTADGTIDNIVAVEDAGIRAYVPLPDFDHRTPFFGKGGFAYDADADAYRCPGGETLRFRKHKHAERVRVDQAPPAACTACALRARCTDSLNGRRVTRSVDEPYPDRVRGDHATEADAKAMRKRKVWVEPLFAEAKDWHGLRRFRLRGLANVNIQGLPIAAGQNLKRFSAATGWGRRHAPSGSLGALAEWRPQPVTACP